ncbi:hypothetical protein H109_02213 [Trichophyton interdigitale MR816]|uniref:EamA domain-containing protein n=1 Tax=Trichophyton interdigitale (strain MR816) TaxID=1215338 RepID=A0A059JDT1_TRIIM|nr:hypothetical protein H109_02213 [Trichophyton interdigitale MR816]
MAGDTIESARSTPSEGASTTRPLMKSADASVQPATDSTDDINSNSAGNEKQGYFAYFRTRQFYIVLLLGQILALCITATNTFSGLLSSAGTSIPAFQTLFNYILLTLVYTSFTLYRYGARKWWSQLVRRDWWKYLIFAFCDVQGNYFIVLAYRYTTILSAQLINFWAIVMVVLISFTLLRVRYHWAQYAGILVCIGGMGVLFGSDHITGANSGGPEKSRGDLIKGDLFALLGATFYGLTNVAEEYLVSKRPMYEVLGQLGMYATVIMGVQAVWNGAVAGYLVGYTLCLFLFYSLAPLLFRLASAAFFNISLLTSNFWGVVIGVKVFGLRIHFLYPIAFVLIIIGQFVYYLGRQVLGEAMKPWLGENQEQGVIGIGTARRAHNTNTPVTPAGTDSNVKC